MREIKFRGKQVDNGEFAYGAYFDNGVKTYIITVDDNDSNDEEDFTLNEVIPESVGQFTGLRDSKRTEEYPDGQEIYEGDIVHCKMISANRTHYLDDYIATVEDDICNPCFALKQANGNVEYDFIKCGLMELEVIGNIHSNPSLLEVQP